MKEKLQILDDLLKSELYYWDNLSWEWIHTEVSEEEKQLIVWVAIYEKNAFGELEQIAEVKFSIHTNKIEVEYTSEGARESIAQGDSTVRWFWIAFLPQWRG